MATRELFILAFDHRDSFAQNLLGKSENLSLQDKKKLAQGKDIIWQGFLQAAKKCQDKKSLAVLIDDTLGLPVLKKAIKHDFKVFLAAEKSGQKELVWQHGKNFKKFLKKYPVFGAKVLARVKDENKILKSAEINKLKQLAAFCQKEKLEFILELLIEVKKTLPKPKAESLRRQKLILNIKHFYQNKIYPDIWKIEGFEKAASWQAVLPVLYGAKKHRPRVIVLGRGQSAAKVKQWLKTARQFKQISGFAIGRTIFSKPLRLFVAGKISADEAARRVAANYLQFIKLWLTNR